MKDTWLETAELMQARIDAGTASLKQAGYNVLAFKSNQMPAPTVLHNELLFAVNLAQRDIFTHLVLLIREPWSRLTVEKMLTLTVCEAENAIENLLGQQRGATRKQERGRQYIDAKVLAEAQETWKLDKQARKVADSFADTVNLIRSTTAAHLYSTHGQRLDTHIAWLYSRADKLGNVDDVMNSQIIGWAKDAAMAIEVLDGSLARMRNPDAWDQALQEKLATRVGEFSHALDPRIK